MWFFLAGLAIIFAIPDVHNRLLQAIYPTPLWAELSRGVPTASLIIAAGCFLAALLTGSRLAKQRSSLGLIKSAFQTTARQAVDFLHDILANIRRTNTSTQKSRSAFTQAAAIGLVTIAGLGLRLIYINAPMRYDEAYTVNEYVDQSWFFVARYTDPNNHVLHTLAVKVFTTLFGLQEAAIRMPALIAGCLTIPAVWLVARMTFRLDGVFAACLIAVWPYHIFYSVNARGYSLLTLLCLLMLALCSQQSRGPTKRIGLFALLGGLANLTMPTAILPIAGVIAFATIYHGRADWTLKKSFYHFAIPVSLAIAGTTIVLYLPVIGASNGIASIAGNQFVKPIGFQGFLVGLPVHISDSISAIFRDVPFICISFFLLILVFCFALSIRLKFEPFQASVCCFGLLVGSSLLILFVKRVLPFERTWLFLVPLLAIVFEAALTMLLRLHSEFVRIFVRLWAVAAVTILLMVNASYQPIWRWTETGYFPEARRCAEFLFEYQVARSQVVAGVPVGPPLDFYFRKLAGRQLIVRPVELPRYFVIDRRTQEPSERLLEQRAVLLSTGAAEILVENTH